MIRFNIDTQIDRPVPEVFAFATDLDRLPEWQTNAVSAVLEADGPLGVGSRVREVRRVPGGKRIELLVEVVEYQPSTAFAMNVIEGTPLHMRMTFEPHGQGTAMRFAVHGQLPGLLRVVDPLFAIVVKRQFAKQCAELKRVLEQSPPASSPAG